MSTQNTTKGQCLLCSLWIDIYIRHSTFILLSLWTNGPQVRYNIDITLKQSYFSSISKPVSYQNVHNVTVIVTIVPSIYLECFRIRQSHHRIVYPKHDIRTSIVSLKPQMYTVLMTRWQSWQCLSFKLTRSMILNYLIQTWHWSCEYLASERNFIEKLLLYDGKEFHWKLCAIRDLLLWCCQGVHSRLHSYLSWL